MTKKKKKVNTKPVTQTELMEGLFLRAYLDFAKRYAKQQEKKK